MRCLEVESFKITHQVGVQVQIKSDSKALSLHSENNHPLQDFKKISSQTCSIGIIIHILQMKVCLREDNEIFKAIFLWLLRIWVNLAQDLHSLLVWEPSHFSPSSAHSEDYGLRDMNLLFSNVVSGHGIVVVPWLLEET